MAKPGKKTCGGWKVFWLKEGIPNAINPCFGCADCKEPKGKSKPISTKVRTALKEIGCNSKKRKFRKGESPTDKYVIAFADLLKNSLTVEQAAKKLRIDPVLIRMRIGSYSPTLYGIKIKSDWLIPGFQFDGNRLVPHFQKVLEVLNKGIDPISFYNWFVKFPDIDLETPKGPLSPRQWLIQGNSPSIVIKTAGDL